LDRSGAAGGAAKMPSVRGTAAQFTLLRSGMENSASALPPGHQLSQSLARCSTSVELQATSTLEEPTAFLWKGGEEELSMNELDCG
jgi:hypothetical protein